MPIEKKIHLYEILIRLGPDGYKGSHAIDLEIVEDTETSEVLVQKESPARPITLKEAGKLLGDKFTGVVEKLEAERARAASLADDLDATKAQLEAATEKLARISAALE